MKSIFFWKLKRALENAQKYVLLICTMRRFINPAIRESLFLLGVWKPDKQVQASAAMRFAKENRQFWSTPTKGDKNILIEGHLAEYGPNYMFRTGLAARAIQEVLGGGEATVVFNGFSYHWQLACEGYRSFGITQWVFLGRKLLFAAPFLSIFAVLCGVCSYLRIRTPRQLLDLQHGGIKVGDLVYDEILRSTKKPTVQSVDWTAYKVITRSWYYYGQYHLLFSLKRYHYYIATHTAYPEYGLLCRVALQRGVTVIETTDIQMSTYDSIGEKDLPTYHQGINAEIRASLKNSAEMAAAREARARESLRRRLDSEIKQIDAQKAYSGRVYTKDELREALGIGSAGKIGFVAAHIFCDSPHLSSSMLHADYYRWLVASIDCCAMARDMNWIIKPHPSCALYGEEGVVEALVREKGASNIHMCPTDLNTSSLRDCADVILTVHGTVGLEYACLGIPSILAGTPFYAGFGFTHEPASAESYNAMVQSAETLGPLSAAQISTALQVFDAWEHQFDWNNPIVTTAVLAQVWGNGVSRDVGKAYELLTQNLRENNPRDLKLWSFASSVAARAQTRMPDPPHRSLLLRIFMRARREILSLVQYAYLYGYAAPRLRLSGELATPFSVSRGHASLLLLSPGAFFKLAVSGKATIREEYDHYLCLAAAQPLLAAHLPSYRFIEGWLLAVLKCERLTTVKPADALPLAVDIQRILNVTGVAKRHLSLVDCPQIQVGLRYVEAEFGMGAARAVRQCADDYLAGGQYSVGLAHGDFHSRNIMRDEAGNCRIIDLDCIRFQGIREFDALYFALEQEWSASGRLWTETLGDCLAGAGDNVRECLEAFGVGWSDGLGVSFFLDRLGQDVMNYGMRCARVYLEPIVNAAQIIEK